ncbi:MAG: hypothetical protein LUH20_09025 [Lachnospiraceae bacterium]|nr:hypothetical protein [Lachnospiraceae bacterium]
MVYKIAKPSIYIASKHSTHITHLTISAFPKNQLEITTLLLYDEEKMLRITLQSLTILELPIETIATEAFLNNKCHTGGMYLCLQKKKSHLQKALSLGL